MDIIEQKKITQNLHFLCENTGSITVLLNKLVELQVISSFEKELVNSRDNSYSKCTELYDIIRTKDVFPKLIQALYDSGNETVAKKLSSDPDKTHTLEKRISVQTMGDGDTTSIYLEKEKTEKQFPRDDSISDMGSYRPPSRAGSCERESFMTETNRSRLRTGALISAAANGDLQSLKQFKEAGIDLNLADYDGRTALHLAAAEGHYTCVEYLLKEAKINPKPMDRWGNLPLDEATRFGRQDIMKLLQKYYSDINLDDCSLLIFAAAAGDLETIKQYKDSGVDLSLADYDGRTALHLAAAEGHLHCVEYLLKEAKVPPSPKDRWGNLPLSEAVRFKHYDVVLYLKRFNADSQIPTEADRLRLLTANLLSAAGNGDLDSLKKYKESGFDLNLADYDGRTALHLAAAEGRLNCVEFLLSEANVKPKPKDRWNNLPLDEAARFRHRSVVKYLKKFNDAQSQDQNCVVV